jgi:peptidoglycan/LPS O-acetylase OafA/YrhL
VKLGTGLSAAELGSASAPLEPAPRLSARAHAKGYVPEIDALRAVAVVAVMIFHMHAPWLSGGYAGVDVFFVISGYVISRSMLELDASRVDRFIGRFYARRVLRIVPALAVMLLVTTVVTGLFIPNSWLSAANDTTAFYAFWGFGNIALMHSGDTYFAPRVEFNPYAHTWSLGVEEQFYFIFPVLFFAWLTLRERPGRHHYGAVAFLYAILGASLVYSAVIIRRDPSVAYYSLPSRFWELIAGALLLQWHTVDTRSTERHAASHVVQMSISMALVAACLVFAQRDAFPFPWAIPGVLGTVGLIDGVAPHRTGTSVVSRWMRSKLLVWIGRRSYSLYLWHWPVYTTFRWTVGLAGPVERVLAVAITVALAALSYRWVETPFRRGRIARVRRSSIVVFGALAFVYVASRGLWRLKMSSERLSPSVTKQHALEWFPNPWSPSAAERAGACGVTVSTRPLADGARVETYSPACLRAPTRATVFVMGNSHALAYSRLLSKFASKETVTVHIYFRSGCTFLKLDTPMNAEEPACRRFFDTSLADIASMRRPGDVLFLPSLRLPRFSDQWAILPEADALQQMFGPGAGDRRKSAIAEAQRVAGSLTSAGMRIVMEAPKPIFRAPAFRCSDWFNRRNPACEPGFTMDRAFLLRFRQPVLDAMSELARVDSAVSVWDPFSTLCPRNQCEAVSAGRPIFFDADHISGYANDLLYPSLVEAMLRVVGIAGQRP